MQKLAIIGVFLLALTVPFFYFAEIIPYEVLTQTEDEVNPMRNGITGKITWKDYPFGSLNYIQVNPKKLSMLPGESLFATCNSQNNTSAYIVIESEATLDVLEYSNYSWLEYRNNGSSEIIAQVYVATDLEGTFTTVVAVQHCETPKWIFSGGGTIRI